MKRFVCLLLALTLAAALLACGGSGEEPAPEPTPAPATEAAPTDAPTEAPATEAAPSAEPVDPPEAGAYVLAVYTLGDVSFEGEQLWELGIADTYLVLNADHTGELVLMGESLKLEWEDTGAIAITDVETCTVERVDAETLILRMNDAVFTLKKGILPEETPAPEETPEPETTPAPEAQAYDMTPLYPGVPYGDSDGVLSREALLALYHWLNAVQENYRYTLNFDQISEAAGKPGCDKRNNDGQSHAAYWTDGGNGFVTVTFRFRNGVWSCGAITSSGMEKEEWEATDLDGYPAYGSARPAGSSPVTTVTFHAAVQYSGAAAAVTAELPTVGWTGVEKSDNVYLYSAPDPEKCEESHSYLLISFRDSLDRIDFYRASFENLAELESRTVGGVELSGRSYRYVGMDWIEYYGEVKDGVWVSVKLTGVAFSPGTETEAIFESLTFAAE